MTDIKEWHAVRPLRKTFTIAVEGPHYKNADFEFETDDETNERFRKLTSNEKQTLWGHFSSGSVRRFLKKSIERCPEEKPDMFDFL